MATYTKYVTIINPGFDGLIDERWLVGEPLEVIGEDKKGFLVKIPKYLNNKFYNKYHSLEKYEVKEYNFIHAWKAKQEKEQKEE